MARSFVRSDKPSHTPCGRSDGEVHSQDGKESSSENRRQRQALPMRQVPQEKSKTSQNTRPVVLS